MDQRTRHRVLVADDAPSIRKMLSYLLEQSGFICAEAEDGESAVVVAREEKFDLIIMDVSMPGISGVEALRAIKQHDPDQAVMMMSGVVGAESASEAMGFGASDYITKPFALEDMLAKIDEAIASATRAEEGVAPRPREVAPARPAARDAGRRIPHEIARDVPQLYADAAALKAKRDAMEIDDSDSA